MKTLKKAIWAILNTQAVSKSIVYWALKMHNLSYSLAGSFSINLEPDFLHPKHRLMKYHTWFATHVQGGWDVLDVGCGNGALAFDLIDNCASVFAIDLNSKNIERAKAQFSHDKITYLCGDATSYPFQKKYSAIILSNVLEHIEHRPEFLIHLFANQNHGVPPILLLRVPMITRDWITLYKKEKGVDWRLDPTHYTEYTLEQLRTELALAGLRIESYDVQFGEFYGVVRKTH